MLQQLVQARLEVFGLLLVRCSVAFLFVPVLGGNLIPIQTRAALAALAALVLTPLAPATGADASAVGLVVGALGEGMVGLVFGLVVRLVLMTLELAGALADMQMGFSFARLVDPLTEEDNSLVERFGSLLSSVLFLVLDGPRQLLGALAASTVDLPVGSALSRVLEGSGLPVELLSSVCQAAVRASAPVVVALLLANVALGLLARAAPQLNLFILGFAISIAVGLLILSSSIGLSLGIVAAELRRLPELLSALAVAP